MYDLEKIFNARKILENVITVFGVAIAIQLETPIVKKPLNLKQLNN